MDILKKILTQDGFLTERIDVHQNSLLGYYDNSGKYFICEEICEELMKMPKIKKSTYNNSMFCISNTLGIGELVFELHFDKKIKKGLASSKMYLLENVYKVNGYYSNTIKTLIGQYSDNVQDYMDKSYKYYNIKLTDDDGREEQVDYTTIPYPYIMSKIKYETAMFKNMKDEIFEIYNDMFKDKMIALESHGGEFGKNVVDAYTNELSGVKDRFLTVKGDDNAKAFNELLDKAVEDKMDTKQSYLEGETKYFDSISDITIAKSKEYNDLVENSAKKVKKHLTKEENKRVYEIFDDLDKRNETVPKNRAWDKGYVEEKIDGVEPIESSKENEENNIKNSHSQSKGIIENNKNERLENKDYLQDEQVNNNKQENTVLNENGTKRVNNNDVEQKSKSRDIKGIGQSLHNLAKKSQNLSTNENAISDEMSVFAKFEQKLVNALAEKSMEMLEGFIENAVVKSVSPQIYIPQTAQSKLLSAGIDVFKASTENIIHDNLIKSTDFEERQL